MAHPLVVGVDASPESLDALDVAVRLARPATDPVFVVHVRHVPALATVGEGTAGVETAVLDAFEQVEQQARTEATRRLSGTGIDWSFEMRWGDPAAELIRSGAEHHAAAILVGGKAHGVVGGLLLGSVAQKLVRHSPISVVVVRDGRATSFPTPNEDGPGEPSPTPSTNPRADSVA
jgi:nucleotide-binding universal stress UspA family protein